MTTVGATAAPIAAPPEAPPASSPDIAADGLPTVELNNILQKLDLTFLGDQVLAMPTRYYVAVSVVCDIVCPFCPRQYFGELVDNGVMSYEAFERIAPHLRYADFAGMFGLGEPFLHRDFFKFVAAAKATGAFTTTNSHGMSLTEDICRRLIDSGIDEVNCSMDGHNPELFAFLREGADFDEVVANLKAFTRLKRELGAAKPELQIAVTISRHNVAHMADMVKLAREVGADKISFSNLIIIDPDNVDLSVVDTPLFQKNLDRAKKVGARYGIPVVFFYQNPLPWLAEPTSIAREGGRFGCHEAWRSLSIERRGETKPCCYIEDPIGNAFEADIPELRNTEKFRALRREMMEGRPNNFCQNCGNLRLVDRAHAETKLDEAQAMLDAAKTLGDTTRTWVAGLIADYRDRAAAMAV